MGLLQKSTSGFGTVSVRGLSRVPVHRDTERDTTAARLISGALNASQHSCSCSCCVQEGQEDSCSSLTIAPNKNQGLHAACCVCVLRCVRCVCLCELVAVVTKDRLCIWILTD